jgi:hypothetical protein
MLERMSSQAWLSHDVYCNEGIMAQTIEYKM